MSHHYSGPDFGFPHGDASNGRTLTDDGADAFLAVLTNGRVTGDKVEAHIDLLAEFPYLGPPHDAQARLLKTT